MLQAMSRNRKIKRSSMSCRETVARFSDYLATELRQEESFRIRKHLASCVDCRRFLDAFKSTIRWTHELQRDDIPSDVLDRLREFLKNQASRRVEG